MEDRCVPATFRWVNPTGGDFATAANWEDQAGNPGVPGGTDDAVILAPGVTVTSAGTAAVRHLTSTAALSITGGTLTAAAANLVGPTEVAGGSLILGGPSTAATVDLSAGTLGGAGRLNITDGMTWTGGTVGIELVVHDEAALDLSGTAPKALDNVTLTNDGTVAWGGTGGLELRQAAAVRNNGLIRDLADHTLTTTGTGVLHNPGRYVKEAGAGVSDIEVSFDNTGTLRAEAGTLRLSDGIEQIEFGTLKAGTWYVGGGATLDVPGTFLSANSADITLGGPGATFPQLSDLSFNTGNFTLTGGANFTSSEFLFTRGRVTVGPGSTLALGALDFGIGGRLNLQVAGRPATNQFGKVTTTSGTDFFDGTLGLTLLPGADPVSGDVYTFVTGASVTGTPTVVQDGAGVTPVFNVAVGATTATATAVLNVTDLSVSAVIPPAAPAAPGQDVTVVWTVKNNAAVATSVTDWTDALYVSASPTFDYTAVLLGRVAHSGAVAGGATYPGTFTGPLPGLPAGPYYVFVRADAASIVPDPDRANNLVAGGSTFTVIDPAALTLGADANGTVAAGKDAWYRVTVPGGTALRLTATFAAAGAGELYVGYQQFPRSDSALGAATDPATAVQRVILPTTQAGTYYVRARGLAGGTFTLRADTLTFDITRLVNATGGNTGSATLTVHGVGFTPVTTVSLIPAGGGTARAATKVLYVDSDTVYATFDLKGLATGSYDVRAADGTRTATAAGGYTVTNATPGVLTYRVVQPATARVGQPTFAAVEFVNSGGTDLPAPLLLLTANGGSVKLPDQPPVENEFADWHVYFLPTSTDAPAGIIPPGYRGSLPVEFTPNVAEGGTASLELEQIRSAPIYWNVFKSYLRARDIAKDAWDGIFANFLATVGKTSDTYAAALRDAATYLSVAGTPVRDVGGLFGYLLRQGDSTFPGRSLAQVTDAAFPSAGLSLDFTRTIQESVQGRYRLGRLGRGWVDNWDISVAYDGFGRTAVVNTAGSKREFVTPDFGGTTYLSADGEDVLTFDGTRFVLTEHDGTVTAFRPDDQLDYLQDPGGTRVTAGYDDAGRLASLTHSNGRALTFTANKAGRIASVTDPAGNVTKFAYGGDKLTSATGPAGMEKYTYMGGPAGRKYALSSITPPGGVKTAFTYDTRGRLTGRTVGKTEAIAYTYGPGGGVTAVPVGGVSVTMLPDYEGRIAAVRDNTGSDLRLAYDADGRTSRVETSAGQVWTFTRDADGRPTAVRDPLGQVVRYAYEHDTLAGYTDARGNTTGYETDHDGNTLAISHPGGGTERFVYDPVGNLVESTNRRGRAVRFVTNADGQVTRRDFADGSHTDYTYDARGNLTAATDPSGTTSLTYFPNDSLQKITYPGGKSLEYTYDKAGRRASSVDQDGFKTTYVYDAIGRLAELRDTAGASIVKYTYDAAGRPSRKNNANGTSTTYAYDVAGRVQSIVNLAPGGGVNSQFDYTHDATGNVATMITGGVTTNYGYDLTGQLTSVTMPGRTIAYTYDAAGNRTSVTDNGVTTTYAVNSENQVTAMGATTFTYDADGNRQTMTDGAGTTTYTWDDLNRLTAVTSPSDTFAYAYDPFDHLLTSTRNGQSTTNLTDPFGLGSVAAQYGPGGLIAHYVHGLGLEARVDPSGGKAFYDFDLVGSVAGLTNGAGAYVNRYGYLPFGETTTLASGLANPFTFVGRWGVSADGNGLFNMRARSYDAAAGGFISDDPLGLAAGDPNVRRYVGNNPVGFIDPSGLKCEDDEIARITKEMDAIRQAFQNAQNNARAYEAARVQLEHSPAGSRVTLPNGQSVNARELFGLTYQHAKAYHDLKPKYLQRFKDLQTQLDDCNKEKEKAKRQADLEHASPGLPKVPGTKKPPQTAPRDTKGNNTPNKVNNPAGVRGGGGQVGHLPPLGGWNAAGTSQLAYSIEFENPSAVLPLHTLRVSQAVDPDIDLTTFRLGDLDLGELTVHVPEGRTAYETRIDARDTWGVFVDVRVGLDLAIGQATWDLTALDPQTLEVPLDASVGLMPPIAFDPASRRGVLYYSMGARADIANGASLDATATITFDGTPMTTATVSNVVDAAPPTTSITPLPVKSPAAFTVSWAGDDGAGGTGIAFYDLYVQVDGGSFALWVAGTTSTSSKFRGKAGHTYGFAVVAYDNAGNVTPLPAAPQATTRI